MATVLPNPFNLDDQSQRKLPKRFARARASALSEKSFWLRTLATDYADPVGKKYKRVEFTKNFHSTRPRRGYLVCGVEQEKPLIVLVRIQTH